MTEPPDHTNGEPRDSSLDDLVLDGYVLQRELSRGGQAIIFSAIKQSTGRKVAVKFFPGGSYATRKEKVRMDREVRVLAALDHPNIVSVIDRGETPDGSTYFVLEYVHGKTLAEYIDDFWEQRGATRGPEEIKALLRLFVRIADAVNAAHLRGVVHRDLKPSNIVVDSYGEPHILDFGVAMSSVPLTDDEGETLPSVTWTGEFLGSVQWASPEQAEGDQTRVDVRSDVYSLAVILYEMLTGDFPYEVFGTLPEVLKNITTAQPRPPSEVFAERVEDTTALDVPPIDSALDEIVLRALAKNRDDRYPTAGEMAKAIHAYLGGNTVSTLSPLRRARRPSHMLAILLGVLVVGGALFWASHRRAPSPDPVLETPAPRFMTHVFGYRMEAGEVVFEFDPRDYDTARMADGSLGSVQDVVAITRVAVAGAFNEWDQRDADWIMERVGRNRFELRKPLSVFGGRYEWPFKFVVNDVIWVSAPRQADNKEVVIEDTATYNLLFINPREPEPQAYQALRRYRDQVNRQWPGQGENLVMDAEGRLHFTLSTMETGARVRDLEALTGIPLSSLQLGEARVTDITAVAEMTNLNWFVCSEVTYGALLFRMYAALREGDRAGALEQVQEAFIPYAEVPALHRASDLLMHSLRGLIALDADPGRVPEAAILFDGRRYLYVLEPMTWTDARSFAERHGASLATVRSQAMQDWVEETFGWPSLGRTLWLGGTDELVRGSWGWLSGDPWRFEHWSPGYPDRNDERARYLAMQHDGWWVNQDGESRQWPFLMEWPE